MRLGRTIAYTNTANATTMKTTQPIGFTLENDTIKFSTPLPVIYNGHPGMLKSVTYRNAYPDFVGTINCGSAQYTYTHIAQMLHINGMQFATPQAAATWTAAMLVAKAAGYILDKRFAR